MATPDLLGMPREILDKILKNLLVVGILEPCSFRKRTIRKYRTFEKSEASAQILRTCKAFYEAGLPILNGDNILFFDSAGILYRWLAKHPRHRKTTIKHILVRNNGPFCTGKMNPLKMWTSLSSLRDVSIFNYIDRSTRPNYRAELAKRTMPPKGFLKYSQTEARFLVGILLVDNLGWYYSFVSLVFYL
jgi:hypothetical protein